MCHEVVRVQGRVGMFAPPRAILHTADGWQASGHAAESQKSHVSRIQAAIGRQRDEMRPASRFHVPIENSTSTSSENTRRW